MVWFEEPQDRETSLEDIHLFFSSAAWDEFGGPRRGVDLILDCVLAKEDGHGWGISARPLNVAQATLVLKQVPVLDDGTLDSFTDFPGVPEAKEDNPIAFEASGEKLGTADPLCSIPKCLPACLL